MEKINMFQDDAVSDYHTSNSPLEEITYCKVHPPQFNEELAQRLRKDIDNWRAQC